MKHKVSELEGELLDKAVAKAQGDDWSWPSPYSTQWEMGGPIIERDLIKLSPPEEKGGDWVAQIWRPGYESGKNVSGVGRSPEALTAAMRAKVVSHFGEEVELP